MMSGGAVMVAMSLICCTLIEASEVEVTAFVPSCTQLLTTQ